MAKKTKKSNVSKIILLCFWGLFLFGIITVFTVFALIKSGVIGYLPPIEELQNPKNKNASEVYSSDMVLLGSFFRGTDNRVNVTFNEISPNMINALIATEDERYREHSGIDERALMRVLFKTAILGQDAGGGSTITQQLAKMLYTNSGEHKNRPSGKIGRVIEKLNEWVIAVELERLYTKEEIIEMYLNQFDFLYNAVGIKMAAQVYFDTSQDNLSIEEAAVLVGMCKNPVVYNPLRNPNNALNRRNTVLSQMEKAGYLTKPEADSIKAIPIITKYNKVDHKEGLATYFREYLRQILMAKKPERKNYASWQGQKFYEDSLQWATNPLFGWCSKNQKPDGNNYNIYEDGLKIYTTINSRMQRYAEEAVAEHLGETLQPQFFKEKKNRSYAPFSKDLSKEQINSIMKNAVKQSDRYRSMKNNGYTETQIDSAFNTKVPMTVFAWNKEGSVDTIMSPLDSIRYKKYFLRSGFMSMDTHNGQVKAYVGGPDYRYFQYDMVTTGKRQVGSTIKPYLYTLAMEDGASPCRMVRNEPYTIILYDGTEWSPRNTGNDKVGEMVSLRWGLTHSNNWISARLIDESTPQAFVDLLHSFGIKSNLDPVVSLALGPVEISVEEMVSAYTAFANEGIRIEPVYVTRIEDNNGNVLANFIPRMNEIISPETSYKMLDLLTNVINRGTGVRLRYRYGINAPIGGKTGTTQNNSDGWFMGFTPRLVSGCWVGGEDRSIHFDNMAQGQGASMALPVWALYMQKVYADETLGYMQDEKFNFGNYVPCKESMVEETAPVNLRDF
jgi:penicillin-binding protein 1A